MTLNKTANDDSAEALAAADHNYQQVREDWCKCETQGDAVYFRSARTGYHGWMCDKCNGVVQTG